MKAVVSICLIISSTLTWAVDYKVADDEARVEALVAAEIKAAKGPRPARDFTDLYKVKNPASRGLAAQVGLTDSRRAQLIRISDVSAYVDKKVKVTMITKGAMVGTIDRVTERSVILRVNRGHGWGQFSIAKDRIRQIETVRR